ncbi:MAG: hypothetical protein IJM98_06615, partial [Oscillospiraceae bacterium]|nr:hypothetical protein [Oscillospiraceae bacterium]
MKNRIISLFLAFIMVVSMFPVTAFAVDKGTIEIEVDKTAVAQNGTFNASIIISGINELASSAFFRVQFDNSKFEVVEFSIPSVAGSGFTMSSPIATANEQGILTCTYEGANYSNALDFSNGVNIPVVFKVKEDASVGKGALSFITSGTKIIKLEEDGYTETELAIIKNESVSVNVSNYISQFNFALPSGITAVPAPEVGEKPVTESGHFGFEELGDGVMYADYYISTADNSVVYEFEPG